MPTPNVKRTARSEGEIDVALAIMCSLLSPGQCVPYKTIAEVTGLSHGGPYALEQNALKKLRRKCPSFFRELSNP